MQAVPGAGAFTGVFPLGLMDWTAATLTQLPLPPNLDVRPTILSVAVECDNPIPDLFCRLQRFGEVITSLNRITISRPSTPVAGFSLAGCHLQVPREDTGEPWLLVVTSGVLASEAVLVVDFMLGGAAQGVS
jgi:hypothetical protein